MFFIRMLLAVLALGLTGFGANPVLAQDYPNKPIRIVTAAAGGGSDFTARQIAQGISGPLGQPVIVDNRTALQASEAGAKAPPDGYTLLVAGGVLWTTPLLQKTPYDISDFSPLSLLIREVSIVAVHPSVPATSVKGLIALAKARPGELNYGSGATGGLSHLAMELFNAMAGINTVRVAYKGIAPTMTALMSGEVQLTINDAGAVAPQAKSGKLRALAVTSAEPTPLAPGLPTMAASGLPGFEATGMTGILAPARTSAAVMNRLNQEIVRVANRADVKERFLNSGAEVVGSSSEQFAGTIRAEVAKWGKVIKDAGIKVD